MHVGSDEPPSPSACPGGAEAVVIEDQPWLREQLRAGFGMSTHSLAQVSVK